MVRAVVLSVIYRLAASPSSRSFMEIQILISNSKTGPQSLCFYKPSSWFLDMLMYKKH